MKTDKKDTKIVISSRQWIMAGINDGSLILEETGIRLNASAFSKDMPVLVKKAQSSFSAGEAAMYGLPGGYIASLPGTPGRLGTTMPSAGGSPMSSYSTGRLGERFIGPSGTASPVAQRIMAVQGTPTKTLNPAGTALLRNTPTAGVRMGLKQPFSAAGTAYSAARSTSGRVMSGLKAVEGGIKAIPGGVSTAAKGLAGAAASGGFRGFMAGNVISAAGSIGAWGIHQGLIAAYDWSRGANVISGAMRTPKGAQDFNKAQEILAQKVMPMMYGHAAGPNEKLVNLNSYIASMTKELESDPGYQAALSGQVPNVMATETLPEDLSMPSMGAGEFNPANQ